MCYRFCHSLRNLQFLFFSVHTLIFRKKVILALFTTSHRCATCTRGRFAVYYRFDGVLDKHRTEPVSAAQPHELLEINRSISDKRYKSMDLFIIIILSNRLRTGLKRKKNCETNYYYVRLQFGRRLGLPKTLKNKKKIPI